MVFGPDKAKALAQRMRNDLITPPLLPREALWAQWPQLPGTKSCNEGLLIEAILRKTLEEHYASIELEHGTQYELLCTNGLMRS